MILLRHGQSEFNLHFTATRRDPGIADPVLTPLGQAQAESAAKALQHRDIRRIIASPYTRALQTAAPLARMFGLPVEVHPGIRERFHFTCDIGSSRAALAAAWPEHNFSHLQEMWWPSETEAAASVDQRAETFRAEMCCSDLWQHTLVVSHWAFILALTGQSLDNGAWIHLDPHAPMGLPASQE